jgi:hypothetical protein
MKSHSTTAVRRAQTLLCKVASIALLISIVILVIPFVLALLMGLLVYGTSLTIVVWIVWCTRGIDSLIVYSDSPKWHDYMLESVIPRLRGRSIVLNWSERRHWNSFSLPVAVVRFFGGDREYNPMVIVFRPFRIPRTFRFWQPFRDRKHGNDSSLRDVENQLYAYLDPRQRQAIG